MRLIHLAVELTAKWKNSSFDNYIISMSFVYSFAILWITIVP